MSDIDVKAWAADNESCALKIDSERLPGFFSKSLVVPEGTFGLIRFQDGKQRLVESGEDVRGSFRGVLVKEADHTLQLELDGLLTSEGLDCQATVDCIFAFVRKPLDLAEFWNNVLAEQDRFDDADLVEFYRPYVRQALASFVSQHKAEILYFKDLREPMEHGVHRELRAPTFEAGMEFKGLRHPTFRCPAYDELRKKDVEARVRAEELKREAELAELRVEAEKVEAEKRADVEQYLKQLEVEQIKREMDQLSEIEKERSEKQLSQFESLKEKTGDDLKAMILAIEDEKVKARLIQQLMLRDLSDEQVAAFKERELEMRMESRLAELQSKMMEALKLRSDQFDGPKTRRLLVVLGKQILAYDPTTNVNPETPKEVYDLASGDLGYLRSVRTTSDGAILAGAQRGVYWIGKGGERKEFQFPELPKGKGGTNSAAKFEQYVYGSHSEMGLVRWDVHGISDGEPMFGDVTYRAETNRGVAVTVDGFLFFSSDSRIYAQNLIKPQDPIVYKGCPASITSFVVLEDEVFAGTRDGQIYRWRRNDPNSPRLLKVRKSNAIYMLRTLGQPGEGGKHLLVGAKHHAVTQVRIDEDIFNDYRAKEPIRWVDGAYDYIYGVTRSGYSVYVWETGRYDEEVLRIRVADRIQDVWVATEEPEATT